MSVRISATDIALCGGMPPETRRAWARAGVFDGGPFSEHDAVETAVASELISKTTTQRARTALPAIRKELRRVRLAGDSDLWVVVPRQGPYITLVVGADEAALAAASLLLPVWLVPVAEAIAKAEERYADLISRVSHTAQVRPLRADDAHGGSASA
jgi:hypothetical protein